MTIQTEPFKMIWCQFPTTIITPNYKSHLFLGAGIRLERFLGVCKKGGFMSFRFVMESWQAMPQLREVWVDVDPHGF